MLESPYGSGDGEWLAGNLHTHTTASDGDHALDESLAAYERLGHDFLAVSDHDLRVDLEAHRAETDLTLLHGVEVTANGPHVLHVGASRAVDPDSDRAAVLAAVADDAGFAVLPHPNWGPSFDHWSQELLASLDGYAGIEIYNGTVEHHPGSALATDRWDRLLAAGHRPWAFGTDDTHGDRDVGSAWTVVRAAERTPAAIREALVAGRSYVSTGVTVEDVAVEGDRFAVETADADRLRLVSDGGTIQRVVDGAAAAFSLPDDLAFGEDHRYVRVECLGSGGRAAWTQPAFIERTPRTGSRG